MSEENDAITVEIIVEINMPSMFNTKELFSYDAT